MPDLPFLTEFCMLDIAGKFDGLMVLVAVRTASGCSFSLYALKEMT